LEALKLKYCQRARYYVVDNSSPNLT
jgi:hypothetical protein